MVEVPETKTNSASKGGFSNHGDFGVKVLAKLILRRVVGEGHAVGKERLVLLNDEAVEEVRSQLEVCRVVVRDRFPGDFVQELLVPPDGAVLPSVVFIRQFRVLVQIAGNVLVNDLLYEVDAVSVVFANREKILIGEHRLSPSIPE